MHQHYFQPQGMIFTDQAHWSRKCIVHCGVASSLYDVVPRVPGKWPFFGPRLGVRLLIDAVAELRLTQMADGPERAGLKVHGYARSLGEYTFHQLFRPVWGGGRGEGGLWVLEAMAARLFEGSLAGEMAEGLRHGKKCS